jgi:membrane protease YdiL (CAAX protease family)
MNDEVNPYVAPRDIVEAAVAAEAAEETGLPQTPWGFWATMGFSVVVLLIFVAVQAAVGISAVLLQLWRNPNVNPKALAADIESNGLLLSLAVILSAPLCAALTVLFAWLRRQMPLRQYLALRPVYWGTMLKWCGYVVLFGVLSDGLTYLLGREIVPSQMVKAYETAGFVPLIWIAIVCAALLFEETFFRGFIFQGIRHSRLGRGGAILITALTWAAIHLQYDAYQISVIFLGGLLLGMARLKTDSLYSVVAMHALWNVIATAEAALAAAR